MDINNSNRYHEYENLHCCWNCHFSQYEDNDSTFLTCFLNECYISPVGICDKFKKQDRTEAVSA